VRLLTYNIREGGAGRIAEIAQAIMAANADVVALQEATDPAVVERVAQLAGYRWWGSERGNSTGFLSRVTVLEHRWHRIPRSLHPVLEVTLGEGAPRLFVVHLRAWFSNITERHRVRELGRLLDSIRDRLARETNAFTYHLIAGDFNALAPDEVFDPSPMPRWIRGMIWATGGEMSRATIQLARTRGYVDAWREAHPDPGAEPGYTFPVWNPHTRLDYVFVPVAYVERIRACEVLRMPSVVTRASDHFPLLVELAGR
jgi:exodeoxyribonuclease-3